MSDFANVARLLIFVAFLFLGLRIRGDRSRLRHFILFVTAMTLLTGFSQREAWPFTNWALFHHLAAARFGGVAVELIDVDGGVHSADARMWQPVGQEEIDSWLDGHFDRLNETQRRELAGWVLQRAEQTRMRVASGRRAQNEWLLGPFAAPYHFLRRDVWTPTTPAFRSVQFIHIFWNPELRAQTGRVDKEVVYSFPAR